MKYGALPKNLGIVNIDCREMMFYQDMPIKMQGWTPFYLENRLEWVRDIINIAFCDFISCFDKEVVSNSYIYLSAKHLYQSKGCSYNRPGWHCDGFMSDDINYIWSDTLPTIFNTSKFNLSQDDSLSMKEMELQALPENNFSFPEKSLLRLNQYNVHRVADVDRDGLRTFVKISFSKDQYKLIGNAHNYKMDYDWEMKERNAGRNIPQGKIK